VKKVAAGEGYRDRQVSEGDKCALGRKVKFIGGELK
jgi:hypothetical protein